ncbi:MAG: hydrogenase formation protein HypD [Nitrospirae bacterium]|nr:MAG: hydrogenase formation protein HypD [Nitrospirota bacterium]
MKYLDEFRDAHLVRACLDQLRAITTRPWTLMEVCGGQTHTIVRYRLDQLLPPQIRVIHGPGCPVCVTPMELIDAAIELAASPEVLLCSFGDMLRVPGTRGDLLGCKAKGGNVHIIYSPLDALQLAKAHPHKQVVGFAVGFETTAPAHALAVKEAARLGLTNYSLIVAHVLVPPALEAILSSPENQVQGFLAAGHVCTIMGYEMYEALARRYRVPIVVTGFEPVDLVEGLLLTIQQLEEGRYDVLNQYARSVRRMGNMNARALVEEVFEPTTRTWRGFGELPASGLALRPTYRDYDALVRFADRLAGLSEKSAVSTSMEQDCQSGLVLQGRLKPSDCPAFGTRCTPEHPLGAPMVSAEGACAAYYRYRSA